MDLPSEQVMFLGRDITAQVDAFTFVIDLACFAIVVVSVMYMLYELGSWLRRWFVAHAKEPLLDAIAAVCILGLVAVCFLIGFVSLLKEPVVWLGRGVRKVLLFLLTPLGFMLSTFALVPLAANYVGIRPPYGEVVMGTMVFGYIVIYLRPVRLPASPCLEPNISDDKFECGPDGDCHGQRSCRRYREWVEGPRARALGRYLNTRGRTATCCLLCEDSDASRVPGRCRTCDRLANEIKERSQRGWFHRHAAA